MQSPFTKAGMDLILNSWQQGITIDDIRGALKADTSAYLCRRLPGLHDGHIYNAINGARIHGDARAIKRFVRNRPPSKAREQSPRLMALFKSGT